MSTMRELIADLLEQRVLVRHDGDHVELVAPLGDPIPAAIAAVLKERKDELLAYLSWRDAADDLLAATMRHLIESYPIGARLDTAAWRAADAAVTAAYWSFDLAHLRAALTDYERFARDSFTSSANSSGKARP
jgi:hypothetical protein